MTTPKVLGRIPFDASITSVPPILAYRVRSRRPQSRCYPARQHSLVFPTPVDWPDRFALIPGASGSTHPNDLAAMTRGRP